MNRQKSDSALKAGTEVIAGLLFRHLPQIRNHVGAFVGLGNEKIHVGAGYHGLWIGQPSVKRLLVPNNVRFSQNVGVVEAADLACGPSIDALEVRPFAVLSQRVASS